MALTLISREKAVLFLLFCFVSLLWPLVGLAANVQGIRLSTAPDHTRLIFDIDQPVEYKIFTLNNPDRLILDIHQSRMQAAIDSKAFKNRQIKGLRHRPRKDVDLRIVLDLKERVRPKSFLLKPNSEYGHRLVLDLYDISGTNGKPKGTRQQQTILAAPETIYNQNDNRPDDQFQMSLFGRPLIIGGEYGFVPTYRDDYSFDNKPDESLRLYQEFQIELLYQASQNITLFAAGKFKYNTDLYIEGGDEQSESSFARGKTWIEFDNLLDGGFGTRIGRQNFSDKREWWWAADLDAINVYYRMPSLVFEYAMSEGFGRINSEREIVPEDEDILRHVGRIKWKWAKRQRLVLFLFNHNDRSATPGEDMVLSSDKEDEIDADLSWIGLRAIGRIKQRKLGRFNYWVDTGYVRGEETIIDFDDLDDKSIIVDEVDKYDVKGWGFDAGVTWISKLTGAPRLTLSYAYGSGDKNAKDGINRNYQQTGIHNNNTKFGGVDSFKYYGEVLRPELSNIRIGTLAVGFPLLSSSSVEFLFLNYNQVYAADEIRGSKLRIDPDGYSPDIGSEVDIVLGVEEWKHLELELVLGLFKAGDAFGDNAGDTAKTAVFKLNYNF